MVRHLIRKPHDANPDRNEYPSWRADTYTIRCERTYVDLTGKNYTFAQTSQISSLLIMRGPQEATRYMVMRLDGRAAYEMRGDTLRTHDPVFYLIDTEPGIPDDQRLPAERIEW